MIDATSPLLLSLTAAVRAHFGLSLPQLARYLNVSTGFVSHLEAGRKGLPPALTPRLLRLSRLLPPPLGEGPEPAPAPAVYDPQTALPAPDALLLDEASAAAEPLRRRLRDLQLRLLTQGQSLARAQTRAATLAHRRRGLAQLQAIAAPTEPTEAARYARWLGELATDLARDDADPAGAAAARRLLAARVAGLRAELATLQALSTDDSAA